MSDAEDYFRKVAELADSALRQIGAVTSCEHHKAVLLHEIDGAAENVAYNLASIRLKDEVGMFIQADLRDAIRSVLYRAAKDECPECARLKDS